MKPIARRLAVSALWLLPLAAEAPPELRVAVSFSELASWRK